jgi:hydroxymethylbilane synthase
MDLLPILAPLNHPVTASCVEAERGMSRALAGSCNVPLGAYAERHGDEIRIAGFVASIDGSEIVHAQVEGRAIHPEALGQALADKLITLGADRILALLADTAKDAT